MLQFVLTATRFTQVQWGEILREVVIFVKHDELCINNDEFGLRMINFVFKMMNIVSGTLEELDVPQIAT